MHERPITRLLEAAQAGDPSATERLFAAIYDELKRVARAQRRRWQGNETLNTTALIHEAFLKLFDGGRPPFASRLHFYATASKAMRHVLVNYAEQQRAAKRGGELVQVPLEEADLVVDATAEELIHLNDLLNRLEADHPRRCRVLECRVFGGMSVEETAEALQISTATVKRDWRLASLELYRAINAEETDPGQGPRSA